MDAQLGPLLIGQDRPPQASGRAEVLAKKHCHEIHHVVGNLGGLFATGYSIKGCVEELADRTLALRIEPHFPRVYDMRV